MSEYDDLLARVRGGESPVAAAPADDYDNLLKEVRGQNTTVAQANLNIASVGNPASESEKAVLARQLKDKLGEDWAAPTVDPLEAKRRLMVAENDHVLQNSPKLARQYLDTGFAAQTFDDVPNLGIVEGAVNAVKSLSGAVGASVWGINSAGYGLARAASENLTSTVSAPSMWLAEQQRNTEAARKASANFGGDLAEMPVMGPVYQGVQSAYQNMLLMPLAFLRNSAAAAVVPMSMISAGQAYGQARDENNASPLKSLGFAAAQGTAEAATELLPMGRFLKDVAVGAPVWKMMRNQLVTENITEQAATAWQDFNEWAMLNPDKPFQSYLDARPGAALDTLIATTTATLLQTGAVQGAMRSQIRQNRAAQAEQAGQALDYLNTSIGNTELSKRDRTTLQQFLQSAAEDEDGAEQTVRINALAFENTLMQAGVDVAQVLEQLPTAKEQWAVAKEVGGDLVLPLSEVAAQTFGTDVGNALLPHIAVGDEAMSLAEAQDFQKGQAEEFRKQAEVVMAEKERDDVFVQSAQEVEQAIVQQLNTANRFTPDVNRAYSTMMRDFYVTTSARMGITPGELFKQFPLNIVAEGQGELSQVVVPTSTVKIGKAFSSMVNTLGRDDVSELLMNWNDSELSNDGTKIILFPGRDRAYSAGELGGKVTAGKGGFLSWLHSEAPLDPAVFEVSDEWRAKVEAARNATGLAPAQTFNQKNKPGEGANFTTGDLALVNPAVRDAVESRISKMPTEDQQRIRTNLEEHKSTAWAAAAVKGMAYREMLERAMAGQDVSDLTSNAIWGKQDMAATKLVQAFQKFPQHGEKILKVLMNSYDFIGGNRKAENDISTSFTNCNPSKACAVHCYAAGSNARPNEIAKSEFTEFMIEHFPAEMTEKIVGDYMATAAGKAGLSLRLNDKGDLSPAQVTLIGMLNEKGVAVQVFSKRPELLRSLSDINLKMLSIDGTNMDVAEANPDLRLAMVITDDVTEEMLTPIHDRVSVYLPVNLKGQAITQEELRSRFPNLYGRMRKENLCPVDGGKLITKPGTSFVDIKDGTSEKGVWTCTACDLYGNAGCFKGDRATNQRKAQTISVSSLTRDLELKRVRKELQSNLDSLLSLGGIDGELHKQLSQALSSGQRALLEFGFAGTEGSTAEGSGGTPAASDSVGTGTGRNAGILAQPGATTNRGGFSPESLTLILGKKADLSTFLHESAHFYLKVLGDLASRPDAPVQIRQDMEKTLVWFGVQGDPGVDSTTVWNAMSLEEQRPYHEKWAESFEAYLFSGKAPSIELQTVFSRFKQWMLRVYQSLKDFAAGHPDAEVNPEVASIFDRLLATDEQIKLAEQARSMMPLFGTEEQSGMTPGEWAAYQELAQEPTDEAKAELNSKGVRDLTWLRRLHARMVKKYNAEAATLREQEAIEARKEVMTQPIYQAWQFLTGKPLAETDVAYQEYKEARARYDAERALEVAKQQKNAEDQAWNDSAEGQKKYRKLESMQKARRSFVSAMDTQITTLRDKLMAPWEAANPAPVDPRPKVEKPKAMEGVDERRDSLFVAIAKLGGISTEQFREKFGIDKKEKSPAPVFGKRVWHSKGKTLDEMRLALEQYGYLMPGDATNPNWNPRELEDRFNEELAGNPQFSTNVDYDVQYAAPGTPDIAGADYGKLNLDDLRAIGLSEELINHLKALRMTAKDGFNPDQVAEQFGFSSGDELARRLAAANTPKEAIEALVDQRMLENHGEFASPQAIATAVDAAIHNEARARLVATELRYLTKVKTPVRVLMTAAKSFADQILGRKKIRELSSAPFISAASRAAANAQQAMTDGDPDVAAAELRNQLLNTTAANRAIGAKAEVERAVKYLKKFGHGNSRNSIDQEYLDQIDQLLERFDLRQVSNKTIDKRTALTKWLADQEAMGMDPVVDARLVEEASRTHYKNLTLDEFRGLVDTVRSIEHLGRLKNRLLTSKDKREFAAVVALLETSIADNANRNVKDTNPITKLDKVGRAFIQLGAHHRKFASLIREMDGGKDGGAMWEYLLRSMNEAGDKEASLRSRLSQGLAEVFSRIKGLNLNTKIYLPEIGTSLRREELLAVALNSGNRGNVQRLLDGGVNNQVRSITQQQLTAVLNRLSNEEWDFVDGVWALIESNRPAIAAMEKQITGVEPTWIEPDSFTLPNGRVIRGGYYPAKYNALFSTRSAELEAVTDLRQQTKGAMGNSSTRKGYTEKRAEEVQGRPLKLDLNVIAQHINEVTHRLAWQAWLIDARRILKAAPVENAIKDHYGVAVLQEMKDHLTAIAEGDQAAQDPWGKFAAYVRTGATIVGMGWNVMTALTQPIGITQSIERVGAKWIGLGMKTFLASPIESTANVQQVSEFMRNRALTINREINEVLNTVRNEKMSKVEASYFYLIQKFQQMVDIPTWLGAYEKAIAEGNNDARAVSLADQAVLDSQGGGQIKDLAGIQRGNEYKKLFTNFYSFFNTLHQRMAENYRVTDMSDPLAVGKLAGNYLLLFVLPTVWMMALKEALRGDDDDEDKLLAKYAKEQLSYVLGTTILGRELSASISGFTGYQGPAGLRFFADFYKFAKQTAQGEIDMPWFKAAMGTAGAIMHLPTGQVSRMVEGTDAFMEGSAGPQAMLVGPPLKN